MAIVTTDDRYYHEIAREIRTALRETSTYKPSDLGGMILTVHIHGKIEGNEEGYLAGHRDGHHMGYFDGKAVGVQEGYAQGYAACAAESPYETYTVTLTPADTSIVVPIDPETNMVAVYTEDPQPNGYDGAGKLVGLMWLRGLSMPTVTASWARTADGIAGGGGEAVITEDAIAFRIPASSAALYSFLTGVPYRVLKVKGRIS